MLSDKVLENFDWNQFEHVALGLINMCYYFELVFERKHLKSHEFECAFWSTPKCHNHAKVGN